MGNENINHRFWDENWEERNKKWAKMRSGQRKQFLAFLFFMFIWQRK
jgi:hypothetical protein